MLPAETTAEVDSESSVERPRNPFLFIVGCPRSGTTMLKRMINSHSQIAITRETHWVPKHFEKGRGVTDRGFVTDRVVDRLFEHHRFLQMKIGQEKLAKFVSQHEELAYADLVSHIYDNYGRRKGKPLVGDKTPTYVRKLRTLHTLWPHAKVIHIIRDGRDVWLSMRQWRMSHKAAGKYSTWEVDPVVTTALWWKALVATGREDAALFDKGGYKEVHYDALVDSPQEKCIDLALHGSSA